MFVVPAFAGIRGEEPPEGGTTNRPFPACAEDSMNRIRPLLETPEFLPEKEPLDRATK